MYGKSNATPDTTITQSFALPTRALPVRGSVAARALAACGLGVLCFSFTLPAMRLASGQLDPLILGPGRGAVAGLFAIAILRARGDALPTRVQLRALLLVALGVVLGFPLLTALALERVPTHHAVVVVGLIPLFTSVIAVLRNGERASRLFWLFALFGTLAVLWFGAAAHGLTLAPGDLFLLAAVLLCALGYAEGGRLAQHLDGVSVICWALVLALPCTLACVVYALSARALPTPSPAAIGGFLYVSLVSSLLGFCAWYRGLALGGVARGSQVQLLQPVLSLVWCATFLHEPLAPSTLLTGAAVLASAAGSRYSKQGPA